MKFIPPVTNTIKYPSAMLEMNQNNSPWIDLGLLTDVKIVQVKESKDISPDNAKLIKIRLHTTIEGEFIHNKETMNDIKTGLYDVKLTHKTESESYTTTIANVKFDESFIHNLPYIKLESNIESFE
ncbi:hypothetical protein [Methanosarcina mazei]|uniref:Uncharacterized protein n=1 Tax=Methanosarcina mazei TaxID=2209 RepID=A0A0F8JV31_METMZ|nr:hypothetical protein [Methanosarcina mazei]KKG92438.1 hypothetical protein DU66_10600 [Methanosarcina mazei]KKG95444.1 hypothetical protein DU69_06290 [Methanosarcina mazei]KKG95825.1 hypothetical protein DU68_16340 [Methanosarcina mazei]KKH04022.1 hypothetical protein DU56_15995 [Methanosarcina mazei]